MNDEKKGPRNWKERVAALPAENIGYATILGFVAGLVILVCRAILLWDWHTISVNRWTAFIFSYFGILFLATLLNQKRMGSNWSNQHWFERLALLLAQSIWGLSLAVFIFDQALLIRSEGFDYWLKH